MTFHPGIVALFTGSVLTAAMICYCSYEGLRIIRKWDINSGSEYQLDLERRTYLISTLMGYVMGFQLLSLFLFIYTVDALSHLFIGAMCAAGSLKVNAFGYPTLILKIINCLLAGIWILINFTDNKVHDYPLIRKKYLLLLFIAPFLVVETIFQGIYMLRLKPDIITSCCSVIFSQGGNRAVSGLLTLHLGISITLFFTTTTVVIVSALYLYFQKKGTVVLALASVAFVLFSIIALISFISIYIYELPNHHCPFCILHPEYGYIGYFFYITILVSGITGIGIGVIDPFKKIDSLKKVIPKLQKRLALFVFLSTSTFVLLTGLSIVFSNLNIFSASYLPELQITILVEKLLFLGHQLHILTIYM